MKEENLRVIEFGSQIEHAKEKNWTNVLGKKHDSKFMVHNIFTLEEEREEEKINEDVSEGIRNNKLHAVTDTSLLHNQMGGCWKIVNFENQTIMSKETFNKKWE